MWKQVSAPRYSPLRGALHDQLDHASTLIHIRAVPASRDLANKSFATPKPAVSLGGRSNEATAMDLGRLISTLTRKGHAASEVIADDVD